MNYLDLKDLVLPYIGIDEYKPKVGTEAEVIVVSFLCKDELPAKDLGKFIEMTAAEILDVDATEVPDDNDNYPVYIEIKRDKRFWEKFRIIVRDVENTTGKLNWRISVYKDDNLYALNNPNLINAVIVNQRVYNQKFLKTDDFDQDLKSLEASEGMVFEAYKGENTTIIEAFELDCLPSSMSKDYKNMKLNHHVNLPTHRIGKYYVVEKSNEIILFKEKHQ